MTEKLKIVLGQVENIVGKGEKAGFQHFLLFLQSFRKASSTGPLKVRIVWQRVYSIIHVDEPSPIAQSLALQT